MIHYKSPRSVAVARSWFIPNVYPAVSANVTQHHVTDTVEVALQSVLDVCGVAGGSLSRTKGDQRFSQGLGITQIVFKLIASPITGSSRP